MVSVSTNIFGTKGTPSPQDAAIALLVKRIADIRFMTQKFFPAFAHNIVDDYKHRIQTAVETGHPLTREDMIAMATNLMREVHNQGEAVINAKSPQSELMNRADIGHTAVSIAGALAVEIGFSAFGLLPLIGASPLVIPAVFMQAGAMTYLAKKSKGGEKAAYIGLASALAFSVGFLAADKMAPTVQSLVVSEQVAKDGIKKRDAANVEERTFTKIIQDSDDSVKDARVQDQKVLGSGASRAELNKATSLTRTMAANKEIHAQYDKKLQDVRKTILEAESEIREKMANDPSRLYTILALMGLFAGGMLTSTLTLSKALNEREKSHELALKAAQAVIGIKTSNKDIRESQEARKNEAALVLLGLQNAYALARAINDVKEKHAKNEIKSQQDVDNILRVSKDNYNNVFPDIDVMASEVENRLSKMIAIDQLGATQAAVDAVTGTGRPAATSLNVQPLPRSNRIA